MIYQILSKILKALPPLPVPPHPITQSKCLSPDFRWFTIFNFRHLPMSPPTEGQVVFTPSLYNHDQPISTSRDLPRHPCEYGEGSMWLLPGARADRRKLSSHRRRKRPLYIKEETLTVRGGCKWNIWPVVSSESIYRTKRLPRSRVYPDSGRTRICTNDNKHQLSCLR